MDGSLDCLRLIHLVQTTVPALWIKSLFGHIHSAEYLLLINVQTNSTSQILLHTELFKVVCLPISCCSPHLLTPGQIFNPCQGWAASFKGLLLPPDFQNTFTHYYFINHHNLLLTPTLVTFSFWLSLHSLGVCYTLLLFSSLLFTLPNFTLLDRPHHNMRSTTFTTAVLLSALSLAQAQTFTDCDPTKKSKLAHSCY